MGSSKLLCAFLLVLALSAAVSSALPRRSVKEHLTEFRGRAAARQLSSLQQNGRVFYPAAYGADPSGEVDSSDAIMSALEDAYKASRHSSSLVQNVDDLGGVVLDLQGGEYMISKPIRFPPNAGNIVVHGGTLRASADFPADGFLLELSANGSAPAKNASAPADGEILSYYYEDITFQDLLLDAGLRGGGLFVIDAVRTRLDNCFVIRFATAGILVARGHETLISRSFLGQHLTAGGDARERNFSGTAIDLASNDNVLTDIVIFSAATGVMLRGRANMLTGIHCYNKATGFGGVGIYVKLPGLAQTRISNCYMDWTGIVMEDPVQVHVTNAFFLGNAYILLRSVTGRISGLNIVDNMFAGDDSGVPIVQLDESKTCFRQIDQVVVDRNNVVGMALKSTVARRSVVAMAAKWVADFSADLLFPDRIGSVQYSLAVRGGGVRPRLPPHAVTQVTGNAVTVESRKAVDGVVSVVVDQSTMLGEAPPFV